MAYNFVPRTDRNGNPCKVTYQGTAVNARSGQLYERCFPTSKECRKHMIEYCRFWQISSFKITILQVYEFVDDGE